MCVPLPFLMGNWFVDLEERAEPRRTEQQRRVDRGRGMRGRKWLADRRRGWRGMRWLRGSERIGKWLDTQTPDGGVESADGLEG